MQSCIQAELGRAIVMHGVAQNDIQERSSGQRVRRWSADAWEIRSPWMMKLPTEGGKSLKHSEVVT